MIRSPCVPQGDGTDNVAVFDDELGEGDLLLDEQIVGVDNSKALRMKDRVRPLAEPKDMTPEQWARHNLTHLPYHPACPCCVAGKRANTTPHNFHNQPANTLASLRLRISPRLTLTGPVAIPRCLRTTLGIEMGYSHRHQRG